MRADVTGGDVSRRILVVHDECVVLAGKICFDAVNGADADASAANALGNDIQRAAAGSCQLQTGGVGMCVAYLHGGRR